MSKESKPKRKSVFDERLEKYHDELKWLYMELYNDEEAFEYFLNMLRRSFKERKSSLRSVDARRSAHPDMHHSHLQTAQEVTADTQSLISEK